MRVPASDFLQQDFKELFRGGVQELVRGLLRGGAWGRGWRWPWSEYDSCAFYTPASSKQKWYELS